MILSSALSGLCFGVQVEQAGTSNARFRHIDTIAGTALRLFRHIDTIAGTALRLFRPTPNSRFDKALI